MTTAPPDFANQRKQKDPSRYIRHGKHQGGSDLWETPPRLFRLLHREFKFSVDAAASRANAKHPRFWDEEADALKQSWAGERVFANPPYSLIESFLKKAPEADLAVLLVTSRTQTSYWLNLVFTNPYLHEIRFIHRGIRFIHPTEVKANPLRAPIPSVILVYKNTPKKGDKRITVVDADTMLELSVVSTGGKPGRPTLYDAKTLDRVITMHDAGKRPKEIREKLSIPDRTLRRIIDRLK